MNKQRKYKQRTLEVHAGEEVDPVTGARATLYTIPAHMLLKVLKKLKNYMLLKKKDIYTPEYPIRHWMFWKKE